MENFWFWIYIVCLILVTAKANMSTNNNNSNIAVDNKGSGTDDTNGTMIHLKNGAIIVTCAAGIPLATIGAIKAIGFTTLGIAKSTYAATLMSQAAISAGGMIASGSPVAVLQSAGALGLGSGVVLPLAIVGGTAAVTVLYGPKVYTFAKDNSPVLQENVGKAFDKVTSTAANMAQGLKITFFPNGMSKL